MRKLEMTFVAMGAAAALSAFAPAAFANTTTAPGQQCPSQGTMQSNARMAHMTYADGGNSGSHMGMGHGPGGMSKSQPFCMNHMQ